MQNIRNFINDNGIVSFEVEQNKFSHSLTRERAIRDYCCENIVVMLSQDVKLTDDYVFYNLVVDIFNGNSVYNYARQVCFKKTIEKYIRKKNYPKKSFYISVEDIKNRNIMSLFASDSCAAYNRSIFLELGGYGGYDIMMNEDMLYSKIILEAGYKKKYCADAVVEHFHNYTFKELYNRYYEIGVFNSKFKIFEEYKGIDSGLKLALYVLGQALIHIDIPVIVRWLPDMASRYLGMRKGKKTANKIRNKN